MAIKDILPHTKIVGIKSTDVDLSQEHSLETTYNLYRELSAALEATNGQGVGLAAPQIGTFKRVFVINKDSFSFVEDSDDNNTNNNPYRMFINPSWVKLSDEKENKEEGCLSVKINHKQPLVISRYTEIQATWTEIRVFINKTSGNKHFKAVEKQGITLKGFPARVFMHEHEHLNGGNIVETFNRQQLKGKTTKKKKLIEEKRV